MLSKEELKLAENLYEQVSLAQFKEMTPDISYSYMQWALGKLLDFDARIQCMQVEIDQLKGNA